MNWTLRQFQPTDKPILVQLADVTETDLPTQIDNCWLAESNNQLVGYNCLERIDTPQKINFWLHGAVHYQWQGLGIGRALLGQSWQDIDSSLAQHRPTGEILVNGWANENDSTRGRLLIRFGLQPYHVYHHLSLQITGVQGEFCTPVVTIRTWQDSHCAEAVALRNRAFANSWGYQPTTVEALKRHFYTGRYQAGFSFTAWQNQRMVGVIHGCWQPRQAAGEAVWIAVDETVRRQGIGRTLTLQLIQSFRQAGAKTISLSADNDAVSPQIGLYLQLGFTVNTGIVDYRCERDMR